jgi:predicted nucleotide-binding protein
VASPHNLEAVTAALQIAQAVVVLFTAEDEARLMERFRAEGDDAELLGQPRPNVFLEAGMAMALGRDRTILTRLGDFRGASDIDGLNAVVQPDRATGNR